MKLINMKKYAILAIFFVVIFALIAFLYMNKNRADSSDINTRHSGTKAEVSQDLAKITTNVDIVTPPSTEQAKQKSKEAIERRQFSRLDKEKLEDAVNRKKLFLPSTMELVAQYNPITLSTEANKNQIEFVSYDPYVLESKGVGDRVTFRSSQFGINREGIIDKIVVDPHEDIVTWSGYLDHGDKNREKFNISQTIKDNYTIGTVTTANKEIYMEIKNGYGWISTPDTFKYANDRYPH